MIVEELTIGTPIETIKTAGTYHNKYDLIKIGEMSISSIDFQDRILESLKGLIEKPKIMFFN